LGVTRRAPLRFVRVVTPTPPKRGIRLTDAEILQARPKAKAWRLFDTHGLFLLVAPAGGKWWRWKYRFRGRAKTISFGTYPLVSLKAARVKRDDARRLLDAGQDPSAERQRVKRQGAGVTFEAVALEWLAARKHALAPLTHNKHVGICRDYLFPAIGSTPMSLLEAPAILAALRPIEQRGLRETAHRAKQVASQISRYAIAHGNASRDAAADLRGALQPVKTRHHAALTDPGSIGALLRSIDTGGGTTVVDAALALAPLVFVRPGELRKAEWKEFDLDVALWRIPGERMKMREAHLVPLAAQALEILRELRPTTGKGRYVFPSSRTPLRPMSNGTVTAALRRLGYTHEQMTAHGFRTIAATRLNEMGFAPDLIERQLAHREANAVRDAYNRAQYLEKRREMMLAWADELDRMRLIRS
jgi:integrase